MSFGDFAGNQALVTQVRQMLARGRFPHSVVLVGAEGAGKYTLALMVAKALFCKSPPAGELPDFCGRCSACLRVTQSEELDQRIAEAVEAREALRETDRRETRIFVQTHPDLLVVPPDPPQRLIKVDQVRRVSESLYFKPAEGKKKVYIFTASSFMKEAANALLKALEEPPEFTIIFLLTTNPGELLPTLRSRCVTLRLAPVAEGEIQRALARNRPELKPGERALVARIADGGFGRALSFDLPEYLEVRRQALQLLNAAANAQDHSALFKITESYRSSAEASRMTQLLRALALLLADVMYAHQGTPELARNVDLKSEIKALAANASFEWLSRAARQAAELESALRRNVLRPLALDALALSLQA